MKNYKSCFLVLLLSFLISTSFAQKQKKLFSSNEVLKLTIKFNFDEVIDDLKLREEHDATISHLKEDGSNFTHNIKISVRGKSRSKICKFPPLKLNFKKKGTKGTVFSKQDKLKLVTHCNKSGNYEEYVKKEYLIYKLYNRITPKSINARLCEITYIDTSNKRESFTKTGILLESLEDVGKRNGGLLEYEKDLRSQESLNKTNLDHLVFFQYLIGNLDWSIAKRHNVKILKDNKNGLPFGVPYDFDYSGFVNTSYAVVSERFKVPSVRTRVFRGFCRVDNYKTRIEFYNSKKEELYNVVNDASFIEEKERKKLIKYFDKFYKILNNKKTFYNKVVKACRSEHSHIYTKI